MAKGNYLAAAAAKAAVAAVAGRSRRAPAAQRKSRRNAKTRVLSRRRKRSETTVGHAEYTRETVARGRAPRHDLKGAWKLLSQNISHSVYAYRYYTAFAGTQGGHGLQNVSPTTSTGPFQVPLHLWELTSAVNIVNNAVTQPEISWTPRFSDPSSTATLTWATVGAQANTLSVENSDFANAAYNNYPGANDTLDWVQSKLLFYAPTARPCRFQVDIVQIKDTRLIPDAANTSAYATAFYQALVKRFAYSPMEPGDSKYQKQLKVLYTNTFILNPKESTESVNTIYRELNVFLRMNRKCTYDWQDADRMNMLGQEGQINTGQTMSTQVHPRARVYLMIRAQAGNSTAFSTALMPSYDITLRMKHSQLNS